MSTDAVLSLDLNQLPDDVTFLKELVAQLHGTIQDRDRRIQKLEQQMHLLVKRFLHPASEKIDPNQKLLFTAAELAAEADAAAITATVPESAEEPPPKKPRKHTPHGRQRVPDLLERTVVFHDLTPEQKLLLGGEHNLVYIGEDVASKFEWTPSSVFVIEHHQKKYVRRETDAASPDQAQVMTDRAAEESSAVDQVPTDNAAAGLIATDLNAADFNAADFNAAESVLTESAAADPAPTESATVNNSGSVASLSSSTSEADPLAALPAPALTPELAARFASPVIVAPRPPEAIPGGMAGPGLLAQVIVSKYADHLPLYRLEGIFARQGVHFARQTLCDWCAGCADLLTPLAELIREEVLASFVIHTDDTPVKLRDAHTKQNLQARFWIYLGDEQHRLTWFEFTNTRKRAGPDRVLANYTGYLQADGYGGYDDYEGLELSPDSPILKVACWAHARRKFHDALRTEPMPAQIALARIGQLYKLEKELRQRVDEEWSELSLEVRAGLIAAERQAHAKPILDEFRKWLDKQAASALPKSPIAGAVRYALNQWDGLCRYIEDGRLAIDNNPAERGLRGIAIGRKNWLFCGSEKGGRTAATLFTIIASALRNKLDPWAYLRDVLTRLPALGEHPAHEALLALLPDRWQPPQAAATPSL